MKHPPVLSARDIMARNLVTFRPEMSVMAIGQVSRRDVLRGIERMRDERLHQPRPESPTRTQPRLYLSATDNEASSIVNRIKRGG